MRHKLANVLKIFFIMTLVLSIGCFFAACGGEDKPETPTKYTVTVENGTGGGEYEENADVTVTATIPEGKVFVKWTSDGQDVSTNNPYTFKVTKDITLTAVLDDAPATYTVTVKHGSKTQETYEETSTEYEAGEEVTITATAIFGKVFTGWYVGETKVSDDAEYTFTVSADVTLNATYRQETDDFNNVVDYVNFLDEAVSLDEIIAIDVKFADNAEAGEKVALCLRGTGWSGIFGYYNLYVDGTLDKEYSGVTVKALEGGWFRLIFDLSALDEHFDNGAAPTDIGVIHTYPGAVMDAFTTACGTISFYGIYEEEIEPDIHEGAVEFDSNGVVINFPEPVDTDKTIAVDFKFTSGDDTEIDCFLRGAGEGNWTKGFGNIWTHVNGDRFDYYDGVSVADIGDGWYRMTIDMANVTKIFNEKPAQVAAFDIYGGAGYTTASGYVKYMGVVGEEEIEPDIHDDAVAVSAAWASLEFEPLDNFAASGKALVFDYKATEDVTSGDDFQFTLWGAGWNGRRTWFVTVDVVNNTVDIGTVEELEDGWYRVTVPCNLLPINTDEGADGTESIGTMVFNTVNHSFLIDEVGAVDYVAPLPTKVMLTSGYEINLPDYDPANVTTLEFDVYVTEERSAYAKVYWNLYDADNNYFGWYRVTYAGLQAADTSGYSVTEVSADSIIHVTLVLSELAGGSGTPGKLVRLADSGASARLDGCWIDNIEFKA